MCGSAICCVSRPTATITTTTASILEGEVGSRTAELVERTRTLERQAAALSEQAALLDLAQDAIVVRDMDGRIVFWNRGAEAIYGWTSHEAVGQVMSELLQAEFSEPAAAIDDALAARRASGRAKRPTAPATVRRSIVASRWALQRDAEGAPVRILTIHNDITGHKQAEAALEQSRSDQIRFKDEFLSHVSHELRSPLTAVKQFTTILLGGLAGDLNKEQREYQQIVLKNIRQLQSMIDDLLEVTRLETGKLTIEPESISVVGCGHRHHQHPAGDRARQRRRRCRAICRRIFPPSTPIRFGSSRS